MALYYFDWDDGNGHLMIDDVGLDCPDIEAVKIEAATGLADLARDVLPTFARRELAILVRDEESQPLLRAAIVFDIQVMNSA